MELQPEDLPNENILAIDGTSGSGKSTLARGLGKELSLPVLETGSLYRATTLLCLKQNVDVHDEEATTKVASTMQFTYDGFPALDGVDITKDITRHDVVTNVSYVSVHPKLRTVISQWVRNWIKDHNGGVVEGRDITSVVAPLAKVRVFVDAPEDVRAKRRQSDKEDNHENMSSETVAEVLAMRDKIDSTREASPLTRVEGVYELDSSIYEPQEMIALVANLFRS